MDSTSPQTSVLGSLCTVPYAPGTIGDAALGSSYSAYLTPSYLFSPNGAASIAYKPSFKPSFPMTLTELYAVPPYITTHDRTVQALKRTVRDLQEENEIAGYLQQIEELKAQLGQRDFHIAELEVQNAELHALTEALRRKLYELQLLAPTCEACHIAFNKRKEDGKLEIKAQKNATVCNHQLGDEDCAKRQKAASVAKSRAKQKEADRVASNEYESTGD